MMSFLPTSLHRERSPVREKVSAGRGSGTSRVQCAALRHKFELVTQTKRANQNWLNYSTKIRGAIPLPYRVNTIIPQLLWEVVRALILPGADDACQQNLYFAG